MIWHVAHPGPDYWSWRCLRCDEPVADHAGLLRLLLHRVHALPSSKPEDD